MFMGIPTMTFHSWLQQMDERLFPRDDTCRPYWSVARSYFLTMVVFLVGVTLLQLFQVHRLVEGGSRSFAVVFLLVFLIFQATVVYLHAISVSCLHHAGGSCQSLANFWLIFAVLHQMTHSVLPLIPASLVEPVEADASSDSSSGGKKRRSRT